MSPSIRLNLSSSIVVPQAQHGVLRNSFVWPVLRFTARRALGRDMQSLARALSAEAG